MSHILVRYIHLTAISLLSEVTWRL